MAALVRDAMTMAALTVGLSIAPYTSATADAVTDDDRDHRDLDHGHDHDHGNADGDRHGDPSRGGLLPTEYADGTPIGYTPEQVDELLGLIEVTEAALGATFPATLGSTDHADRALGELGYDNFGVPAPGGYWHYINRAYVADGDRVVPERAESLVYQEGADGALRLVSAMFMSGTAEDVADLPEEIRWYPGWHGHPELCVHVAGGFAGVTDPDDPDCPPGARQATTPVMFHVWIVDSDECDHRFGGIGIGGIHCAIHPPDRDHDGHHEH